MPALQKKAANLIDHCSPVAEQARPHPVQRLQIQLLVGLPMLDEPPDSACDAMVDRRSQDGA